MRSLLPKTRSEPRQKLKSAPRAYRRLIKPPLSVVLGICKKPLAKTTFLNEQRRGLKEAQCEITFVQIYSENVFVYKLEEATCQNVVFERKTS